MDFEMFRPWVVPLCVATGGFLVGWLADRIVLGRLQRLAAATTWRLDDLLVSSVRGLVMIWTTLIALHLAGGHAPVSATLGEGLDKLLIVLWLGSMTMALGRFLVGAVKVYATDAMPGTKDSSIIGNVVQIVVWVVGALVILQSLGISITPVLTALGVGGLAVALALQDTLANLFAGLHIIAARHIRPGDFIRIDDGNEGFVQDIGWRNTLIRKLDNNQVVIPNSKLAGAIVTNQSLPDESLGVVIPLQVAYDSDLEQVERVLTDEATQFVASHDGCAQVEGLPVTRFTKFNDSGIDTVVVVRAKDINASFLIRHLLHKRIHARLKAEGITIPFPTRTMVMDATPRV